eukprot:TRINITY_DN20261_c0_g1_i1.p1 TRINITY_DN20261_c0_g1~~TRINITY_DN20261_c0_g1_i1.p1  ORF type:complete len:201 (+),score=20.90 TRINITY_DN20261_c0_g1_i1:53-604(+)
MPGELHLLGQLSHATGFGERNLFVLWEVVSGAHWEHVEGAEQGQTHVLASESGIGAVFAHPIDVHYRTRNIQGWPRLVCHVWHQDQWGRKDFIAYGFAWVPCSTAGCADRDVVVQTWRPLPPSCLDRVRSWVLGGATQLRDPGLVWRGDNRYRLSTVGSGQVHFRISVIAQHFGQFAVTGVGL